MKVSWDYYFQYEKKHVPNHQPLRSPVGQKPCPQMVMLVIAMIILVPAIKT